MSEIQCVMSTSSQMKNSNQVKFIKTIEPIVGNSYVQIKKNAFLLEKNQAKR